MTAKSKFSAFMSAFTGLFKAPFQRAFERKQALKKDYGKQGLSRHRFGSDPYPNHRHKSEAEKARIAAFHEQQRRHTVTVGTNHERVVRGRSERQGLTVEEYQTKYGQT